MVTGGSAGIGRASAIALAEAGANVTVCARNADALEATCAEAKESRNVNLTSIVADVSAEEQIAAAVDAFSTSRGRECRARVPGISPTSDAGTLEYGAQPRQDAVRAGHY